MSDATMKDLYRQLAADMSARTYRCNNRQQVFGELAHFVTKRGKHYDSSAVRLFLVGRCTNGWPSLYKKGPNAIDAFAERAYREYLDRGYAPYFAYSADAGYTGGNNYRLTGSAFWRVARNIWRGLSQRDDDEWLDFIAWSNLFKAAPDPDPAKGEGANPTQGMIDAQFKSCLEILKQELADLLPTHVIFVTGWDGWFEDRKNSFAAAFPQLKRTNEHKYIEGEGTVAAKGRAVPALVLKRPEYRNESEYVQEVLAFFNERGRR